MSDATQDGERPFTAEDEQGRQEIRFMLDDRHRDEWELVHGAYGVEELPSELDARHGRERASLEKRLDLLPPKPGEFATLDDFMRASEPALQDEIAAGMAEVRAMRDAAIREDKKLWHEDLDWDDPTRQQLRQSHKEFHADIEHRLGEYQPLRGEFASLDAFMSATEHLAVHEEVEAMSIRDGEAAALVPGPLVQGFFSVWDAAENLAERAERVLDRFWGAAENAAERLARVADITLGAVIGYFVDEPKMTAAQVHDTLQATAGNVELIHGREVAAAEAIEAGAHEFRMLEMKGGQQEHDLRLAMTLGTNATAEANIGLDEHEGARRTQKLSL